MAPDFDREMGFFERILFAGGREWACTQATGEVLEIGVGSGRNLQYYPGGVTLTGVDFSSAMLGLAEARAHELQLEVDLRLGDAQALDFADASFDTVVCTLALCSIPDDARAVTEAMRVLRPGGRFILMEHVGSPNPVVRGVQRAMDIVSIRYQGDHQCRRPMLHLRAAGFDIEAAKRSKLGIVQRITARKPVAT